MWEWIKNILGWGSGGSGGGSGSGVSDKSWRCRKCRRFWVGSSGICPNPLCREDNSKEPNIDDPAPPPSPPGNWGKSPNRFSIPNWLVGIALIAGLTAVIVASGGIGTQTAVVVGTATGVGLGAAGSGEAAPVPTPPPTSEPEASDPSQPDGGISGQAPTAEQESTGEKEEGRLGVCADLTNSEWHAASDLGSESPWKFTAGRPGQTAAFSQPGANQGSEELYTWTGPYDGVHLELRAPRITYNNGAEITVTDELSLDLNPTECDCMTGTSYDGETQKGERIVFTRVGRQAGECSKE